MQDIHSSLPTNKRPILADLFEIGRSRMAHTYEFCGLASNFLLLTAAFVLALAICGCGSGAGTPISGALSLTPGTLQFGDVLVGVEANTSLDVANHGPETVVLSQIKIAGQTFSVAGGDGLPVTIPSGGTHTLNVGFAPVSEGDYSGALSLIDASARIVGQAAIYGHGSAGAPQLSLSAASVSFGNIAVNGTAQKTLTLKSIGTQPVTLNSAATSAASFSVEGTSFPVTLNPGQSMNLTVRFQPAVAGIAKGQFSINSNSSAGATTMVALSGTGIAAASSPQLSVSASSLSFGSVTVGTSVQKPLTLRSTGTSPVTVNSAAISGTGFRIVGGSFPVTLNPGQSATLVVQYQPTAATAATGASGQLSINSNSSTGATTVVALSGTGIAAANPQLSSSANSLTFGSVTVGTSVQKPLTLRSTGTSPVTVNSASISGAVFTIAGGSLPVTINPGQSMTVVVQFKPTAAAGANGQLSINSNSSTGATTAVALSGTGIAAANPQLVASANSLTFGSVTVGTSVQKSLTLRSTGTSPVTVNSAAISGTGFRIVGGSFPVTLNPGQSATVVVQFKPTAATGANGQLSINSNSSTGATTAVALSGTGIAAANPQLVASANSLTFGSVTVGTSVQKSLTLRSTGTSPVTVNSASISGAGFTIAGGSLPVTINPGQSMTVVVQFKPTAAAGANGQLSINSNSSTGATTAVALSGTGIAAANPQLVASANSLTFGSVTVGTSVQKSLTLRSTGTSPVTVNSAAISGAAFTIAGGSLPVTLNPGQSITVVVQFKPTAAAGASGQLSINSNSSTGATTAVALSGTGTAAANPQLVASANSLTFGSVTVGTSVQKSLTLRSAGTSPVTVNSASISGAGFTIAGGSFPVTLNPGQSATVVVQFKPTAAAGASGQLSINSNSSTGATTAVALSGTGIAAANPQLSASANSLTFGSVTAGTSVQKPLTLRSTGTSPVTVNAASISGAVFTIAGGSFPVTLNPGQSLTISIQFQPTAAAGASGQLSINSNSSTGATTVVALSGTGTASNPKLTANATSLNFGSVAVNTATTSSLNLNSTGSTPVTVSSAKVQGDGFTIVGGSFPATLNPGQVLSLQLRFQPTVAGAATGQLTITSNSLGGGSIVLSLSGVATAIAHEVDLSWLPPSSSPDPVAGYNIYRSVSGGAFVRLNSVVSLPTTYVDSTVVSSVSYGYVAKSVDAKGVESTASNEYQVTIP